MASPQVEHGFLRIANELVQALMRINLSAHESRILWALWAKTYGYNKKEDWISNSQFVDMTGLRKQHVSRATRKLKERGIVTRTGYKIKFNKDYSSWVELPKQVTHPVTPMGYAVTPIGDDCNPYGGTQKKTILQKTKAGQPLKPDPWEPLKERAYRLQKSKTFKEAFLLVCNAERDKQHPGAVEYALDEVEKYEPQAKKPYFLAILKKENGNYWAREHEVEHEQLKKEEKEWLKKK